ncbi:MAG: glycosyltransferase [Syntrophales bacterium]
MAVGMEIAFFGSSLVSAYWNGAATYYRGIIKELAARGHRITFYEPDIYNRQDHRDIPDPEWARVFVYPGRPEGMDKAIDDSRRADLLIKASGVGIYDDLLEKAVLDIRKPGVKVIFWDVDAPATLDRIGRNPNDPFRALVPCYDLILTYGGGRSVVDAYRSHGARACIPVYNALDPSTHFPAPPENRFSADLGFLGNRLPDRESRVDDFFFGPASALPHFHFILGGNGWHDKPRPANVEYLGHVYTRDHNSFNSSAKAVLNVSRESMARYGYCPATRVFEAAGAGACMITDEWEGIEMFFDPGSEIIVAKSGLHVVQKLEELTHEKARRIGEAARRRVLAEHTYAHRAEELDRLLN